MAIQIKHDPRGPQTQVKPGRQPKYPFASLNVNDYFVVPKLTKKELARIRNLASMNGKRFNCTFRVVPTDEGAEVWRVQ